MTSAQKRRDRARLTDTATTIFCAGIAYNGVGLSIEESVERASVLMMMADLRLEKMYGKEAAEELPQVP